MLKPLIAIVLCCSSLFTLAQDRSSVVKNIQLNTHKSDTLIFRKTPQCVHRDFEYPTSCFCWVVDSTSLDTIAGIIINNFKLIKEIKFHTTIFGTEKGNKEFSTRQIKDYKSYFENWYNIPDTLLESIAFKALGESEPLYGEKVVFDQTLSNQERVFYNQLNRRIEVIFK